MSRSILSVTGSEWINALYFGLLIDKHDSSIIPLGTLALYYLSQQECLCVSSMSGKYSKVSIALYCFNYLVFQHMHFFLYPFTPCSLFVVSVMFYLLTLFFLATSSHVSFVFRVTVFAISLSYSLFFFLSMIIIVMIIIMIMIIIVIIIIITIITIIIIVIIIIMITKTITKENHSKKRKK